MKSEKLTLLITVYKNKLDDLEYWISIYNKLKDKYDFHWLIDGDSENSEIKSVCSDELFYNAENQGKFKMVYNHIKKGNVKTWYFKIVDPDDRIDIEILESFNDSISNPGFIYINKYINHDKFNVFHWPKGFPNHSTILPVDEIKNDNFYSGKRIDFDDDQLFGMIATSNGAKFKRVNYPFYIYVKSSNQTTSSSNFRKYILPAYETALEMKDINLKSNRAFINDYQSVKKWILSKKNEYIESGGKLNDTEQDLFEKYLSIELDSGLKTNYISWYYAGNIGDDILLINYIQKTNFDKYVILNTKYTPAEARDISKLAIATANELVDKNIEFVEEDIKNVSFLEKQNNYVTYIGGSIWPETEVENKRAELSRLKSQGVKIIFFGNNLSKFMNEDNYVEVSKMLNESHFYSVRDSFSCSKIENCSSYYFDPIYSMESIRKLKISEIGYNYITATIAKAPKHFNNDNEDELFDNVINNIKKYIGDYDLKLLSFQNYRDLELLKSIKERLVRDGLKNNIQIVGYVGDWNNTIKLIANSKLNICTRFHSIVLSNIFSKKTLPVIYDNKNENHLIDIKHNESEYTLLGEDVKEISINSEKQFKVLTEKLGEEWKQY